MKKFSKITNQKVGIELNVDSKLSDIDILKYKIMDMMDNYLSIQFYGPINRYQVAGTSKVVGKDIFVEALIDMLGDFSTKENVKLLESLKGEIKNWEFIDNKIDELNKNKVSKTIIFNHKEKIKSIINRYSDENDILKHFEFTSSKIKNVETAFYRKLASESLISENKVSNNLLKSILNIYNNKFIELNSFN